VLAAASVAGPGIAGFCGATAAQTQRRLTRRRPGRPAQRPVEASPPQGSGQVRTIARLQMRLFTISGQLLPGY
jgi:hypothetical protein